MKPIEDSQVGTLGKVFGCDVRSLAIFRMALGIIILCDLVLRSTALQAMYTDAGIFGLEAAREYASQMSGTKEGMAWSLHLWSGSSTWQIALFILAGLAATMLTLGWRTRLATVVCWVLVASVQARNPFILTSGDTLLKLLLFWSMFLPLGAVWSIDAKRSSASGRQHSSTVLSMASAGILLQVLMMYFFTGVSKCNDYWFTGAAMEYVLRLDIYATDFGRSMLEYPTLLKWVTWTTLIAELAFPLLLLSPWLTDRLRLLAIPLFWALHIGIALSMQIGLFSFISMIAWLTFLPTSFWESGLLSGFLRRIRVSSPALDRPVRQPWSWPTLAVQALCACFLVYFFCWNVSNVRISPRMVDRGRPQDNQTSNDRSYDFRQVNATLDRFMPSSLYFISRYTNTKQSFLMFNIPPLQSPWFVYEAQLADGTSVDIFRDGPVDFERPDSVRRTIPHHHWRRLHRNLARPFAAHLRDDVAEYVVRDWNATHPQQQQAVFMKLTAYLDEIGPDYNGTDQIREVWYQFGDSASNRRLFDDLKKKLFKDGEDIF